MFNSLSLPAVLVNTNLFILFGQAVDRAVKLPFLSIDVANIANISFTPNYNAPADVGTLPNNQSNDSSTNTINGGYKENHSMGLSKGAIGGIVAGAIVLVRDI